METVLAFFRVNSLAEFIWVIVGLVGQLLFTMRFLIQWLASEKARKSVVPEVFWWFSIGGGLILFAYALHRRDPVFILGQSLGIFIYARNLWLVHAEKRSA
ncbi:lipid-A-disaccharide synthase N-terminal domain-containing protein [Marinibacterium sp. SX1]|uniref:lipid-A-disaccharide synthase N-terminal domain-containing protein n=1 Tax=Marinibacterium sp. SX1 TaxID=3388424 RepID=UPI003D174B8E